MAQDIELLGSTYLDVPAVTLPKSGGGLATFHDLSDVDYAGAPEPGGNANATNAILFGTVDSTSTDTAFTATVPGLTELTDGTCIMLKNGVVTSASGFTIDVNGLGAKPSYNNMAAATRDTTIFNVNYTMLFIYDSTRVSGGAWICYRGYNSNDNTIGYQVRTNSSTLPAAAKFYRYRLLFTSADGTKWVPANTSTSTNATASRTVNQTPIDPFGPIVYYGTTTAIEANANVTATQLWEQYTLTLGYSFNRTGAALVLTYPAPVYIKCAPQLNGSAIIDSTTPYVQSLPSTDDGKIYILLGRAYSATAVELLPVHPVYWHDGDGIRLWTGVDAVGTALGLIESYSYISYSNFQNAYDDANHMTIRPADTISQQVLTQLMGSSPEILVPSDISNIQWVTLLLNANYNLAWVSGTTVELAPIRAYVDLSGGSPVAGLFARGTVSTASGIVGVDDSWTIAALDGDGVSY